LIAAGVDTSDEDVRAAMADLMVEARRQLMEAK
jgi:hypothetical protein